MAGIMTNCLAVRVNWTGHHLQNINQQCERQIPFQNRLIFKIFVTFDDIGFIGIVAYDTAICRARKQEEL